MSCHSDLRNREHGLFGLLWKKSYVEGLIIKLYTSKINYALRAYVTKRFINRYDK